MQLHRQDVYMQTPESFTRTAKYHCRACNADIKFLTQTCKQKVDKHERGRAHQLGLKRLGLVPADQLDDRSQDLALQLVVKQDEEALSIEARTCSGVPTKDSTMLPVHSLQESILNYVLAGQPRLKYSDGEDDPLTDLSLCPTTALPMSFSRLVAARSPLFLGEK